MTDSTMAEQIADFKQTMAAQAPAEVLEVLDVFTGEQADLDTAGLPPRIANTGVAMPDGDLLDVAGDATSLAKVLDGGPAVIVFYRGAWCPYCNLALKAYQEQLVPVLAARGVQLVAISPQRPDGSLDVREKNGLTYTVLSDPGNQIASQLGILTSPSAQARATQVKRGLDLTTVNADGTLTLPMPTVVVVDRAGTIRWIDVHPNYATRSEPADILAAVADLN
jgi:peroxiredoxin